MSSYCDIMRRGVIKLRVCMYQEVWRDILRLVLGGGRAGGVARAARVSPVSRAQVTGVLAARARTVPRNTPPHTPHPTTQQYRATSPRVTPILLVANMYLNDRLPNEFIRK